MYVDGRDCPDSSTVEIAFKFARLVDEVPAVRPWLSRVRYMLGALGCQASLHRAHAQQMTGIKGAIRGAAASNVWRREFHPADS